MKRDALQNMSVYLGMPWLIPQGIHDYDAVMIEPYSCRMASRKVMQGREIL